ncbi:MAG: hypothetical protein IT270_06120 [Saprospiraceae bacterium]|nr:hypothetical protein [Saprospiraceae bacterium]
MNNASILPHLWRFLGLTAVQILIFNPIAPQAGQYFNVLLYPLFILLLPIKLPTFYAVLLGFLIGLSVDLSTGIIGLHASAGAFSGFVRNTVLLAFQPKGGFSGKEPIASPAYFGWAWFLQVTAVFFLLHTFWYFSVDSFTFAYLGAITLKTLSGWILSLLFVVFYGFLFYPKQ